MYQQLHHRSKYQLQYKNEQKGKTKAEIISL